MIGLLLAAFLAGNVQDADTRALLQSEDAWASALVSATGSFLIVSWPMGLSIQKTTR